jgi:hypothetical protein
MPNTTLYGLPYAAPGDPADGAGNEQSMMGAVELAIRGPYVIKGANQSISSANGGITQTNDLTLLLPVVVNATYVWSLDLRYGAATGVGIKVGWTVPAGASMIWSTGALDSTVTAASFGGVNLADLTAASTPSLGYNTAAATILHGRLQGTVTTVGASGSLQFQWSQTTLSATNTTVYAGSVLRMQRLV